MDYVVSLAELALRFILVCTPYGYGVYGSTFLYIDTISFMVHFYVQIDYVIHSIEDMLYLSICK